MSWLHIQGILLVKINKDTQYKNTLSAMSRLPVVQGERKAGRILWFDRWVFGLLVTYLFVCLFNTIYLQVLFYPFHQLWQISQFFLMPTSTRFLIVKENILGLSEQCYHLLQFACSILCRCLQGVVSLIILMIFISMLSPVGTKYLALKQ